MEEGEPPSWVSDPGRLLDEYGRRDIDLICKELHDVWRVEVAVVVLDSLPEDVRPTPFAAALLNYWGVGDAKLMTGVLVLLLLGQRQLHMCTGYGAARVLPATTLQSLQAQHMLPHLRAGAPSVALSKGLSAIREVFDHDAPKHWRRAAIKGQPANLNKHGFGGGQTSIDDFLPPKQNDGTDKNSRSS